MRARLVMVVIAGVLAACGRIGFGPIGPGDPEAQLELIELWRTPGELLAAPLVPGFEPQIASYAVRVGLAVPSIKISARPLDPTTTITIDGVATAAGALSTEISLDLGTTVVTVVGTSVSGATATYTLDLTRGSEVAQEVYIKAPNTGAGDRFSYALALSGDTLAVSARDEDSSATGVDGDQADNTAIDSGAVYIFGWTGAAWTQQAYLKASNTGAGDRFGYALAFSADTLAVGAPAEDSSATGIDGDQGDGAAAESGAVYVFTRTGGVWTQQAYLKASNTGAGDDFGHAIALAGDTLVVGAGLEDSSATGIDGEQIDNSAVDSGAVYVFARTGTAWTQEAYLKASNTGAGDQFGGAVALSGQTLAVGAYGEASSSPGIGGNQADNGALGSGAVYVFTRTGTTWSQQAYIKASNPGANDVFGWSVALDGDALAVGAPLEGSSATGVGGDQADNSAPGSGAVYAFTRSGTAWTQQAYLKASNTEANDQFGFVVALAGDVLVTAANFEDSSATGIEGDQTDNSAIDSGAAYVFARIGAAWSQMIYLKASNTDAGDALGHSIVYDGNVLAIGSHREASSATGIAADQNDNSAANAGALYIFR